MTEKKTQRSRLIAHAVWLIVCLTILVLFRQGREAPDRMHHDEARARATALLSQLPSDYSRHQLITSARSREGEVGWIILFNIPGSHDLEEAVVVKLDRKATRILSISAPGGDQSLDG